MPPDDETKNAIAWDDPEQRTAAWHSLILSQPRSLSRYELADVMPPRGPTGSTQNRARGARIRMLHNRGFTLEGKPICGGRWRGSVDG